ncbi:hypothetical protein [Mesorhizobium sp. IMUNJ 23232]|uniref:hypothetical protein n=1 Tax=Mesorhizobium sp. IMUNJ 23232 TaxID=3376064 RepID=UPI0037B35960
MRFAQVLSFGTEGYPPKIARRLRVFNLACWSSALLWLVFAVSYLSEPKLQTVAVIDFIMAIVIAALPVLHRFGPRTAVVSFALVNLPAHSSSVFYSAPKPACRCSILSTVPERC